MSLVTFKDLPDTSTPINANNLNNNFEYLKSLNDYSANEVKIGTWINDKPLYKKVIDFGNLPNNTSKTVNHLISNLDQVTKIEIISKNLSSNAIIPIPYFDGTNRASIYISTSGIIITTNTNVWSNNQTYVTLEYTKTTD